MRVYQRTGIPSSQVPADLTLPTTPTTLAKAQQTVQNIKLTILHTNTCKTAVRERASWLAHKPKPPAKKPGSRKKGTRRATTVAKPYPAEPALPGYCQALGIG